MDLPSESEDTGTIYVTRSTISVKWLNFETINSLSGFDESVDMPTETQASFRALNFIQSRPRHSPGTVLRRPGESVLSLVTPQKDIGGYSGCYWRKTWGLQIVAPSK